MHFGKYKESGLTAEQVFDKDPAYMLWVYENLKGIRFANSIQNKIKKYKLGLNNE
jgi:hypothetical protein